MDYSRSVVCGKVATRPVLKKTTSGTSVCAFSVCTTRKYLIGGVPTADTTTHRVVVYGRLAEACHAHMRMGDVALVDGQLQERQTPGEDGQPPQQRLVLVAEVVRYGL